MSRSYEMTIVVLGHSGSKYEEIVNAVADLGFDADADHIGKQIVFCSEVINITIGNSCASVAREIHEVIWNANGSFCEVNVGLRDLDEEIPCYTGDETRYYEWVTEKSS